MVRSMRWLLALALLVPAWAGSREASDVAGAKSLLGELKEVHAEAGMPSAVLGFCQIALEDGSVVVAYDADTSMIPASTMKAVTTASALDMLGSEFRFETKLAISGEVDAEGVLRGDVLLVGDGDPTLAKDGISGLLSRWKAALAKAGVKKISGRVIADERVFDTRGIPDTWIWNDIGNYFGCGAYGLNVNENAYRATFIPGKTGASARFSSASPRPPGVTFVNEMRTGAPGSGDQGYIFGGPYTDVIYLRGSVPGGNKSFSIRGSLPDPGLYAADALAAYLKKQGIPVEGGASTSRLLRIEGKSMPKASQTLDTLTSGSMQSMLTECNHWSRNLYAECFLKMIGHKKGSLGGTEAGAKAATKWWSARGVKTGSLSMFDGSGLSRYNLISARQMAGILAAMSKGENGAAFKKTLPVAGRSGTLRSVGKGTSADGRVHAKSGTMDRVKCYAGYVDGKSGRKYAFALFVNGYACSHGAVKAKISRLLSRASRL